MILIIALVVVLVLDLILLEFQSPFSISSTSTWTTTRTILGRPSVHDRLYLFYSKRLIRHFLVGCGNRGADDGFLIGNIKIARVNIFRNIQILKR